MINWEDILIYVDNDNRRISVLEYVEDEEPKFYEYIFYFGDILQAIELYQDCESFFDYIMSYCKTYIIDKSEDLNEFNKYVDLFNNEEYQLQGLFNASMYALVGMAYTDSVIRKEEPDGL